MINSGGFKKFKQYTHEDQLQIKSNPEHNSPVMKANMAKIQSISKSVPVNCGISKTLEGVL